MFHREVDERAIFVSAQKNSNIILAMNDVHLRKHYGRDE
jgi:hypothetical protein